MSDANENKKPMSKSELLANAQSKLQPTLSKSEYIAAYNKYKIWCNSMNENKNEEDTLMAYFNYLLLEKNQAPTTVWSSHSKIKSMLVSEEGININKFPKLHLFMSKIMDGYESKQATTFLGEEINKFFMTAPDEKYLLHKVSKNHIPYYIYASKTKNNNQSCNCEVKDASILLQTTNLRTFQKFYDNY